MKRKINLGIVGYGNLGKGVELAIRQHKDMELVGIFSRRGKDSLSNIENIYSMNKLKDFKDKIDVMILCGGSARDLPEQCPDLASIFNTVDSYDNHSKIPEYFKKIDTIARKSGKVSLISVGWDPGLFSLNRLLFQSIMPQGNCYTFWGEGVSQGHSDAIRRVRGVKKGIQYTVPIKETIDKARIGESLEDSSEKRHKRVCYLVAEKSQDIERIEEEIRSMPGYFLGYDTEVHFITDEEFEKNHINMPHGGFVIHSGNTGKQNNQKMEFNLALDNNPEFTSSVLVAYARAVYRLSKEKKNGAFTVFDIPFSYLSAKSGEDMRRLLL